MSCVCGIYFGNTTISIAIYKEGKTEVITNDSGDRLTPAVVAYNQNEFITGMAAKSCLTHNASGIIINNKQLINDQLAEEELEVILKGIPCPASVKNCEVLYNFNQTNRILTVTPEGILGHLFKKMFSIASNVIRSTNIKVVISVPLHFSQKSRQNVWSTAESVGFTVLQIISEPSAAVLAYELNELSDERVLVYRLGGISCDATVIQIHNGLCNVLATVHDKNLGGNYFTKILADYIAKEFMNRWKLDPQESKKSMNKLMKQAEFCKYILSTKTSTSVFIESLCDGVDWEQNMTRPRFENLISPHMIKYMEPIKQCLSNASLTVNDIGKVILCGGSTRIPKLQSTIVNMFRDIDIFDEKPDEIIAEGCARQASFLESAWDRDCTHLNMYVPFLTKDIYVCNENKQIKVHVKSFTPLPVKMTFTENLSKDSDQNQAKFFIYEENIDKDTNIVGTASFPSTKTTDFLARITKEKIIIEAC